MGRGGIKLLPGPVAHDVTCWFVVSFIHLLYFPFVSYYSDRLQENSCFVVFCRHSGISYHFAQGNSSVFLSRKLACSYCFIYRTLALYKVKVFQIYILWRKSKKNNILFFIFLY